MISLPSASQTRSSKSVSATSAGNVTSVTNGVSGARLTVVSSRLSPFAANVTLASSKTSVTATPIFATLNSLLAISRFTAARRFAFFAGPICWMGYQNWLKVLVS